MRVFALDPGGLSGWAFVDTERGVASTGCAALPGLPAALLSDAHESCRRLRSAHVAICEDYNIRPHQARQQDAKVPAREGLGIFRAACFVHEIPMTLSSPGYKTAGRAWILDRLPQLETLRRTLRSDHERDALDIVGAALRQAHVDARKAAL